jgi:hypothetical protein
LNQADIEKAPIVAKQVKAAATRKAYCSDFTIFDVPERGVLRRKPALRPKGRSEQRLEKAEQREHGCLTVGDSLTKSTRMGFRYTQAFVGPSSSPPVWRKGRLNHADNGWALPAFKNSKSRVVRELIMVDPNAKAGEYLRRATKTGTVLSPPAFRSRSLP